MVMLKLSLTSAFFRIEIETCSFFFRSMAQPMLGVAMSFGPIADESAVTTDSGGQLGQMQQLRDEEELSHDHNM